MLHLHAEILERIGKEILRNIAFSLAVIIKRSWSLILIIN